MHNNLTNRQPVAPSNNSNNVNGHLEEQNDQHVDDLYKKVDALRMVSVQTLYTQHCILI